MHIRDKVFLDRAGLEKEGPITIVAFGDSITHGALGTDEINYETVYWNLLREKILNVRNYVPVNVINAGIGGVSAKTSLTRLQKQVIAHSPDLVIVCFGLNDVNGTLEEYLASLRIIFEECARIDTDIIFMTPNMLNTYVSPLTAHEHLEYAARTAQYQNSGKMDLYISSAIKLASEMGIVVCDCYSEWKKLNETQDTTQLLANYINHPKPEMHELFANMLFDLIFQDASDISSQDNDTMYRS
ncbi:MAG: SGNH/GDSL hydrolase family protein [Clostridia bacterium]|nr:SGNH/GDSL hydrolase family protein [Clostridia bacterium]